jgi:SAM-dependent methyltransferase
MSMPAIETRHDEPAVDLAVVEHIRNYAKGRDRIDILEAGCGRRWPYRLDDVPYVLTGVDTDADALRIRQEDKRDLDHAVLGDLRSVHFPLDRFDIVYSAFVLEHLAQTDLVLTNFLRWVKPGGLIILKFPDRDSVYGFVTRMTPYWVHLLYKRHVVGNPNAGKPGFGPYPTVHEPIIARRAFREFIRGNDLVIREECGFGTLGGLQNLFIRTASWLSLGRLTANYYNLLYVLATPPRAGIASGDAPAYGREGVSSIDRTAGESPIEARSAVISST